MNYLRLVLAAFGGLVASFAVGFLIIWLVPALMNEAHKYPTVFRPREEMNSVMPIGIVANFIAVLIISIIFALIDNGTSGVWGGARLGILIGIFAVCNVGNNYMNLNIGPRLAVGQGLAYLVQWLVTGIVIGLIYKPAIR
ncbi:MAG TPA: DUF1761 family protein [Pyrinomonadaceae bacterium]